MVEKGKLNVYQCLVSNLQLFGYEIFFLFALKNYCPIWDSNPWTFVKSNSWSDAKTTRPSYLHCSLGKKKMLNNFKKLVGWVHSQRILTIFFQFLLILLSCPRVPNELSVLVTFYYYGHHSCSIFPAEIRGNRSISWFSSRVTM